jgi:thiol-disulfide isomerase/thioredoxin
MRAVRRFAVAATATATLFAVACVDSGARPVRVGATAPTIAPSDLAGRTVALSDFRGRVVLVDFWATWCGPCHLQRQILEPLYREYRSKGAEFLAVSVGEDADTVKQFVAGQPFAYPVLIDPADELSPRLGISALPTLLVVDRDGKVSYFEAGVADAETLRRVFTDAGV